MRKDGPYDQTCSRRRCRGTTFDHQVWIASAEDTIQSKLLWYKTSPVLRRPLLDASEVYEIQELGLDQSYLDHWVRILSVVILMARIPEQAALPPSPERGYLVRNHRGECQGRTAVWLVKGVSDGFTYRRDHPP